MEDEEKLSEVFEEFVRKTQLKKLQKAIRSGGVSLVIDFQELDQWSPELSDAILENIEKSVELFEDAITKLDLETKDEIHVRFTNLPQSSGVRIKDLRSRHLKKLVVVEGLIRQASEVRPEAVEVEFECMDCGNKIAVLQTGFSLRKPSKCICGKKYFKEIGKKLIDVQNLKIEECPEQLEGGEQPSRVDVILQDDLVEPELRDRLTPGNHIRVIGCLREMPIPLKTGGKSKRFDIYVRANNVETLVQEFEKLALSPEDIKQIKELSHDPRIKEKLAASIAPSIYGHKEIKQAIALQLFGGIHKTREDKVHTRGDIHILLVGDPGAAKSQLLRYVTSMAPKAMYVSGRGASGAGLTATVMRDEFLRGWVLEAGALVIANKGLVAIDEVDKMNKDDRVAIHEVMEQGTVSVAKANIHATLRAQTSVLGAANPKYSRFDPYRPIVEQIDMPDTLLSRFDLIFTIRDIPSRERDSALADHILRLHKDPLGGTKPAISTDLLRKYIAYAKKNYAPRLSTEALEEIKKFFVDLRSRYSGEDERPTVPISPRQLEALIRLTEAGAKMRLSEVAEREDALSAIDIFKYCLYQVGVDPETGKLDIDRFEGGVPASTRGKIGVILEIIRDLQKIDKIIPKHRIIEEAQRKDIKPEDVEEVLDNLKAKGDIFEPRAGEIQKL